MKKNDRNAKRHWLRKFMANPWVQLVLAMFGIVGVVLAVVGIVLVASVEKDRCLVYAINPVRTKIVTTDQASELEITYLGEALGNVDITAVQIAIWNSGELPIWLDDVLEPIVIVAEPALRILEATVRHPSRSVTQLHVDESPELLQQGIVRLSWRILETGDGASIQLIYLGSENVEFAVQGTVAGQKNIALMEPLSTDSPWPFLVGGVFFLLFALGFLIWFIKDREPWYMYLGVLFTICPATFLFWQFAQALGAVRTWPPFGF